MKMCLKFLPVVCMILVIVQPVFSEEFTHLTIEDGLAQSTAHGMIQDKLGFLWFGTEDGLNRYDGYEFKVFKPDPLDPFSISNNYISTLYQDSEGIIWVGTNGGGLNRFVPENGIFTHYIHHPENRQSVSGHIVRAVCEDKTGGLWIGTEDGGLCRMDRSSGLFEWITIEGSDTEHEQRNNIRSLAVSGDYLWIGPNRGGLFRMNLLTEDIVNVPLASDNITIDTAYRISKLFFDQSGRLWVGTGDGLALLDSDRNVLKIFKHDTDNTVSLSNNDVRAVTQDSQGRIWVGTDGGGLSRLDEKSEEWIHFQHNPYSSNSLSKNEVRGILIDTSGILWISTYGGGVNKMRSGLKKFRKYSVIPGQPDSLNNNMIWSFLVDSRGNLYVGTGGGGLNVMKKGADSFEYWLPEPGNDTSLQDGYIRSIYEDSDGYIWVGTEKGGLSRYDVSTKTFSTYLPDDNSSGSLSRLFVRRVLESRDKQGMWVATNGGGLNYLDKKTGVFKVFRTNRDDPSSLSHDSIYSLYIDKSGTLWAGTFGGGLNRFNRETGTFDRFLHDPSDISTIPHNIVLCTFEDSRGLFWVCTSGGGICLMDRDAGTFTPIENTLNKVVYGILEDSEGNFWMSTNLGLVRYTYETGNTMVYTEKDGLQSNEFNGGAFYQDPASGKMFFGGIRGFNCFLPEDIKGNTKVPSVALTDFRIFNRSVTLKDNVLDGKDVSYADDVFLSYTDKFISFEFSVLEYSIPEKNSYAYFLEGFQDEWITTGADQRRAVFTNLDPGDYVLRVKGSNNDGVWCTEPVSINIHIKPPVWKQWWFIAVNSLIIIGAFVLLYFKRLGHMKMKTELQAAHNAQMSVMPQIDPEIPGLDVSGICMPAHEVGGDFFDFLKPEDSGSEITVVIGDVSGKAMNAAMTAVMVSGMSTLKGMECSDVAQMATAVNRSFYIKSSRHLFTAMSLASINADTLEMSFTNCGLNKPFLKRKGSVTFVESKGVRYPIGAQKDTVYSSAVFQLEAGDVLLFYTDGLSEIMSKSGRYYGKVGLKDFYFQLNTDSMKASEIRDAIIKDALSFSADGLNHDDLTVIVVKVQ